MNKSHSKAGKQRKEILNKENSITTVIMVRKKIKIVTLESRLKFRILPFIEVQEKKVRDKQ